AFSSENRVEMFLKLLKKEKPVDIATELDISRAGLQKHLEALLETGLLVKQGSGRNTKYLPTKTSNLVLQHLEQLGILLEIQREVLKLEETLAAIETVPDNIGDANKTEFVKSLKAELKKRTQKLETTSTTLHTCLEGTKDL
ncbi:MAG: ArsR/SmtB family transcription factor, partial [Candidatus Hodarchaeota archaeon]